MSDRLTTSALEVDLHRRLKRRGAIGAVLFAVLALCFGLWKYMARDPLAARLVGAWKLESTPSGTTDRRTVEFHEDGRFWVYNTGKRDRGDTLQWWVSEGDLVVVFENPLTQPARVSEKAKELGRRALDPTNTARSYRYAVTDAGGEAIHISLVEERGNPPDQLESAVLTREADQPAAK